MDVVAVTAFLAGAAAAFSAVAVILQLKTQKSARHVVEEAESTKWTPPSLLR